MFKISHVFVLNSFSLLPVLIFPVSFVSSFVHSLKPSPEGAKFTFLDVAPGDRTLWLLRGYNVCHVLPCNA